MQFWPPDDEHETCKKGKAVPLQARRGPGCSRKLRFPDFVTTAQDGGRLSALSTGRLYPCEILPSTHYCSQHVEAWHKRIVKQKFCATSWVIAEINILKCTVSKTSKFTFISEEAASFVVLTTLISQEPKHAVRILRFGWIYASTATFITSVFFWGVTQCIVIIH